MKLKDDTRLDVYASLGRVYIQASH